MTLFEHIEYERADNLLRCFEEIHDYIYAHEGLRPHQVLAQMVNVLLAKLVSETSSDTTVQQMFSITEREREELQHSQVSPSFAERIKTLFYATHKKFAEHYVSAENFVTLSLPTIGFVVKRLQHVVLSASSGDAKGLAFQKFLSANEKHELGQYFTPEPVIKFCVEMLNPQSGETIIDPACGSGGFLIAALRHVLSQHPTVQASEVIQATMFGMDINADAVRIATLKLLLEAQTSVNILCGNSLELNEQRLAEQYGLPATFQGFDIVLANPPFGAKYTQRSILSMYELGHKWTQYQHRWYKTPDIANSQNVEALFLERCLNLLREGGRMAIVLPDGYFENSSLEYLRQYLKQRAIIRAVIRLPPETFIPFGTGVKTSIVFAEKHSQTQHHQQHLLFFGSIHKLGYQGNKNGTPAYCKDSSGSVLYAEDGRPLIDEDISLVVATYKEFLKSNTVQSAATSQTFALPVQELNGRLDYEFYAPENRHLLEQLRRAEAARLCDVVEIVKAKSSKLSQPNERVRYVELSDINTHALEIINATDYAVHELPSRASFEIRTGDILTAIAGNSVGSSNHATAIVTEEYDGCICTNGFRVLRTLLDKRITPAYLLVYLRSEMFLRQLRMLRTGAAIPSVSDADFASVLVAVPTASEIATISANIEEFLKLRRRATTVLQTTTKSCNTILSSSIFNNRERSTV